VIVCDYLLSSAELCANIESVFTVGSASSVEINTVHRAPASIAKNYKAFVETALNSVSAENTKRAYSRCLGQFLTWIQTQAEPRLERGAVQRYRVVLESRGLASATINQALAAIRTLAREAGAEGLIPGADAPAIEKIRGVRRLGRRTGTWLNAVSANKFLSIPDRGTLRGKRDFCLLTLLIGSGLRRSEASLLRVDQIQLLEDRWVLANVKGKHGRVRTVPLSIWVKEAMDAWLGAAPVRTGYVLRAVDKVHRVAARSLSTSAIYQIVKGYGVDAHMGVAPHDMRRSFARLAMRGGAPLDQIQVTLGHESLRTTELYLGLDLDLAHPACDFIRLDETNRS
jgi:integrase